MCTCCVTYLLTYSRFGMTPRCSCQPLDQNHGYIYAWFNFVGALCAIDFSKIAELKKIGTLTEKSIRGLTALIYTLQHCWSALYKVAYSSRQGRNHASKVGGSKSGEARIKDEARERARGGAWGRGLGEPLPGIFWNVELQKIVQFGGV